MIDAWRFAITTLHAAALLCRRQRLPAMRRHAMRAAFQRSASHAVAAFHWLLPCHMLILLPPCHIAAADTDCSTR